MISTLGVFSLVLETQGLPPGRMLLGKLSPGRHGLSLKNRFFPPVKIRFLSLSHVVPVKDSQRNKRPGAEPRLTWSSEMGFFSKYGIIPVYKA